MDERAHGSTRVGDRLRAAREAQGLDIAAVAATTRIPIRHLQAIEASDHAALPAMPYSAGFVKVYARTLGLDSQTLSNDFRDETAHLDRAPQFAERYEPVDPARVPSRGLAFGALALAILLAVGYLWWRGQVTGEDPRTIAAAERPVAAAPAARAAPAPAPASGGPVSIVATDQVWLQVYERDGPTLFMGILEPGERYDVPATAADPLLLTGRPGAIKVTVGAAGLPPLGDPRKTIKDVSLKPDALLARGTAPAAALAPLRPVAAPTAAGEAPPVASPPAENATE